MDSFRKLIVLALIAPFVATRDDAQGRPATQVQDVDARFRKAMIEGDAEALKKIVADDAKIVHGNHGGIQSKTDLIRNFRSYQIEKYDRTPVYSLISGDTAVLLSVTHKQLHGKQVHTTTTEVLIRRSGRWQILVLQNTDHSVG